jgi:hypothetical protein
MPGNYNAGEFVELIYADRMRSSDDKMHVIQLFEKVLVQLFLPYLLGLSEDTRFLFDHQRCYVLTMISFQTDCITIKMLQIVIFPSLQLLLVSRSCCIEN